MRDSAYVQHIRYRTTRRCEISREIHHVLLRLANVIRKQDLLTEYFVERRTFGVLYLNDRDVGFLRTFVECCAFAFTDEERELMTLLVDFRQEAEEVAD